MKRNMDLIRDLLFHFEQKQGNRPDGNVEITSYDRYEIAYHLILLAQGGYIDYEASRSKTNRNRLINVIPGNLTWEGHELLETMRDTEIWQRTKGGAAQIGSFGIDVIKALAKGYIRKKVKKLTDIELDL